FEEYMKQKKAEEEAKK
ncbi:hypothetical protein TeGR_g9981, partial [Tetraparma gracilis]